MVYSNSLILFVCQSILFSYRINSDNILKGYISSVNSHKIILVSFSILTIIIRRTIQSEVIDFSAI